MADGQESAGDLPLRGLRRWLQRQAGHSSWPQPLSARMPHTAPAAQTPLACLRKGNTFISYFTQICAHFEKALCTVHACRALQEWGSMLRRGSHQRSYMQVRTLTGNISVDLAVAHRILLRYQPPANSNSSFSFQVFNKCHNSATVTPHLP